MKRIYLVPESLNEFAKRGRPKKSVSDEEFDFDFDGEGPDSVEDVNIDTDEDLQFQNRIRKVLKNELNSPEFNRGYFSFIKRSTGEEVDGIPMAELKDGFLFKVDGKLIKVNFSDMIVNETLSQSSTNYSYHISNKIFENVSEETAHIIIDQIFEIISDSSFYELEDTEPRFYSYEDFYGFKFKSVEPSGEINYHEDEIEEYSLRYDEDGLSLVFENNGYDHDINSINDIYQLLKL